MKEFLPLCVTPSPMPYESWLGYLLRVSVENGLRSPKDLLMHAKVARKDFKNPPLSTIATLTNKSIDQLSHVATVDPEGREQLARHPLSRHYLDNHNHKVCPHCIEERKYIDARWDLYHYTVCDVHQMWLEDTCRNCRQKFDWMRPNLKECNCKAVIVRTRFYQVPQHLLEITKSISALFEGKTLSNLESKLGLPLHYLSNMSLQTILGITHSLGARNHQMKKRSRPNMKNPDAIDIGDGAGKVFANWPNNFFTFLEWDGGLSPFNETNVVKRNSVLFYAFFKMNYPWSEVEFLFKHFALYAKLKGFTFELDAKDEIPSILQRLNSISKYELAEELGLDLHTLKGDFLIPHIESVAPIYKARDNGKSLPLSRDRNTNTEIAQRLGFPLMVINSIMSDELPNALHKDANFRKGPNFDTEAFQQHLNKIAITYYKKDTELVPLKKVMRSRSISGRLNLLKSIVSKEIWSYKVNVNDNEIFLDSKDVQNFVKSTEALHHDSIDLKTAATYLECDVAILSQIISNGLIEFVEYRNTRRVRRSDLEKFNENYILLSSVAKLLHRSSASIRKYCHNKGIHLVASPMKRLYSPLIIRRKDLARISTISTLA